jgi:uncharacterized membrane protein YcaP (DUF421 family)
LSYPIALSCVPTVFFDTLAIYVFLIFAFRFLGRRQLGQLNVIDLVIILIMGSAVETALIGGNTSLPAGLTSAATLLAANRAFSWLCGKSRRLRHLVTGGAVLLVHNGHVLEENLRRTGFTMDDVVQALRGRGCAEIADVRFAVLEEDGEINVVTKEDAKVVNEPNTRNADRSQ